MAQEVIEITEREIEIIEVIERGPVGPVGPVGPTGPQANINYMVVSSSQEVSNRQMIAADTSGGSFTLTLPSNPAAGDAIDIFDYSDTFDTNPLTIARNGQNIEGLADDLVANVEGAYFTLIFTGGSRGWQVVPRYGVSGLQNVLTTEGDLLYRGSSAETRLGIGTAGQILKVNSGATAPEWGNEVMSSADKTKLDGIAAGAEANVNADWNATSGDAQILNKPSTFPPSSHTHDSLQSGSGTALDTFTVKSGGVHGRFLAKTFNTTDPSIGIESYNTSNVRIGFALLGIRSTNGFLQGGSNTFRIEQGGGALARLQLRSIVNSSNNQLSLPSTAGTLALTSGVGSPVELVIACSDETSNLTVGANKVTFRAPYAFTLTGIRASVNTAPTGSTLIVDINEGGTSVLSTKLSIDASEKTSTTAASAAVISDSSIANDAEITIDIDQIGSTIAGKGLKVVLLGTRA